MKPVYRIKAWREPNNGGEFWFVRRLWEREVRRTFDEIAGPLPAALDRRKPKLPHAPPEGLDA